MVEEHKTIIKKVKDWLYDNFYTSVHSSDYGDYTTLGVSFDNFEEMMDDFNKKIENMKYKVGDKVLIKSLDWYNQNKDGDDNVPLIESTYSDYNFIGAMRGFCGKVMTISSVNRYYYNMVEDDGVYYWTDEMIEGLAGEHKGYRSWKHEISLPEGYIFKDENDNVLNATKIVLEKKKHVYPKTYQECCKVLGWNYRDYDRVGYKSELLCKFQVLLLCRDAYWKIAGEEMGLGGSWKPSDSDYITERYCIFVHRGNILCDTPAQDCFLTFPTEEMRDAFYENFKFEIEICKELL